MWSHLLDVYWAYKGRREAKSELDTDHLDLDLDDIIKVKYGEYWECGRGIWDEASYYALESPHAWPNRARGKICHCFGEYAVKIYSKYAVLLYKYIENFYSRL